MSSFNIQDFSTAHSMSKDEFKNLLSTLSDKYYNGNEDSVSDTVYDNLVEIYTKRFGEYKVVGAVVRNNKVKLSKYMGSLDKVKTQKELDRWIQKNNGDVVVITDKIDGISALYDKKTLSTRGDGVVGSDITYVLPYLKLPLTDVLVRGEIYMPKSIFNKLYSDKFSNARNMTAGLLNASSKERDVVALSHLRFLAYEYDTKKYDMGQQIQLMMLSTIGFKTPEPSILSPTELTVEILHDLLERRKEKADYEMDGLVISSNIPQVLVDGENPKNAIAFKVDGECVTTTVEHIEWNASKHGVLKPRVKFNQVKLGVDIDYATGFNAKFISDKRLCRGAVISVTRSGDVIPYIKEVITPGDAPQMPECEYKWNDTNTDIYEVGGDSDDTQKKRLCEFFKVLGAKHLGEKTIEKLYNGGYNTIYKILNVDKRELLELDGVGEKSAERILAEIQGCTKSVDISKLACACGVFGLGFGEKRIDTIFSEFPDIIDRYKTNGKEKTVADVRGIRGFKEISVQFVDRLDKLIEFLDTHPQVGVVHKSQKNNNIAVANTALTGKTVVFTGGKDKELEEKIQSFGGKVTTSVSKNTHILVTATRYSGSSKEVKAEQLGVEILTRSEFMKKYLE